MTGSTAFTWSIVLRLDTLAILLGFVLDLLFGDPIGRCHPVCLIGDLITSLENRLLREKDPDTVKFRKGILLVCTVCAAAFIVTAGILFLPSLTDGRAGQVLYLLLASVLCDTTLAMRDLYRESMAVRASLGDLQKARKAVSRIVGRDTQMLDEAGVTRAAVETVAENTTDGVIAPLFYLLLGGPAFAMVYKAVNTMDSMIGYRNDRYLYFGRAAAKLDDVLNYIPARLAALLWIAAAWICREDARGALRIWRRDRRCHESPNSAQTESACAGSLGVRLAGDAVYFGKVKKKPTIGDPDREIGPDDIRRANRMMFTASALALAAGLLIRCILLRRIS